MALSSLVRRAILLWMLAGAAAAQIDLNPQRDPSVIRVDVNLVNLLCTVRDKKGAYFNDLSKDDFAVLDNGRRQTITHFVRQADSPLTVAVMLDVSSSVVNILDTEKAAANQFFASVLRPGDQALLVGFAQYVLVWQDLTSSKERLHEALDRAGPMAELAEGPVPRGGTLLRDAVNLVAAQKLARLPGRKTAILITDGEDLGSRVSLVETIRAAHEADAVIYGIYYVDRKRAHGTGLEVLQTMSEATGGRTFQVGGKVTIPKVFAAIEEEMRNQYAIGYALPEGSRNGEFHKLQVKPLKPGLTVQARNGYYAAK